MAAAFSVRLKRLRKSSGLTMEALADAAGISKSYVWELEHREAPRLSAKVVNGLAKALGVTSQELMGEPQPVQASPEDLRFFRKYVNMDKADKERLRKMVDLFDCPTAVQRAKARRHAAL